MTVRSMIKYNIMFLPFSVFDFFHPMNTRAKGTNTLATDRSFLIE